MRWPCAALLLAVLSGAPQAQEADSLARPPVPVVLETVSLASAASNSTSGDTTTTVRTPRGAVTRALLAPGLGQLYNRQPVKAPVATVLVAGAIGYFVDRQRQYILYRRATAYAGCVETPGDPDTSPDRVALCVAPLAEYGDEYDRLNATTASELSFATLRAVRAQARSQRDIGGVVVLAAYALQALDAYIAAELADFDVSEDLGLRVLPGPDGPGLGLRVRL